MNLRFLSLLLCITCVLLFKPASAQIPNGGFENWADDGNGNFNPTGGWETTNFSPDTSVMRFSPGYAGSYAMMVRASNLGGFTIPGAAYLEIPFTQRPSKIHACIKTNIATGDMAYLMMGLTNNDSSVAAMDSCTFKFDQSQNWLCVDYPIAYINAMTPDTLMIVVMAGNFSNAKAGTYIIVDDLQFKFGTGVDESWSGKAAPAYPNPANQSVSVPLTLAYASDVTTRVFDLNGREVQRTDHGLQQPGALKLSLDVKDLQDGLYFYTVEGNDFSHTSKLTVKH
jgi:hypothetical protein